MKHLFITLCLLSVALFSSAQGEKTALLITHYGSSDPDTRALTLDVITREAKNLFRSLKCAKRISLPSFGAGWRSKAFIKTVR